MVHTEYGPVPEVSLLTSIATKIAWAGREQDMCCDVGKGVSAQPGPKTSLAHMLQHSLNFAAQHGADSSTHSDEWRDNPQPLGARPCR